MSSFVRKVVGDAGDGRRWRGEKGPTMSVPPNGEVGGGSAFSYALIFLPFIRSRLVPTKSMPGRVRW